MRRVEKERKENVVKEKWGKPKKMKNKSLEEFREKLYLKQKLIDKTQKKNRLLYQRNGEEKQKIKYEKRKKIEKKEKRQGKDEQKNKNLKSETADESHPNILKLVKRNKKDIIGANLYKKEKKKQKKKNNVIETSDINEDPVAILNDKEKSEEKNIKKDNIIDVKEVLKIPLKELPKLQKEDVFDGTFKDLNNCLSEDFIKNLENNNYIKTTKIQKVSIPLMLNNYDIFLKSLTGSGKTLCYAVPAIQKILNAKTQMKVTREQGTFVIVIAPTRELVMQIYTVFFNLTKKYPYVVVSCVVGGDKKKSEKNRIRKGVTILTCTPGRLLDHMQHTKSLKLTFLKMVIIDEADKIVAGSDFDMIKCIYDRLYEIKEGEYLPIENGLPNTVENTELGSKKEDIMLDSADSARCEESVSLADNRPYEDIYINTINRQQEEKKKRSFQMVFISATLNHLIKSLTNYCLTNKTLWVEKKKANVEKESTSGIAEELAQVNYELPENLKQFCVFVDTRQKFMCLLYMLLDCIEKNTKPVVFFSNYHSVEYFKMLLSKLYWPTDTSRTNIEVMRDSKQTETPILHKEDENLLKKYLEQSLLNNYKEDIRNREVSSPNGKYGSSGNTHRSNTKGSKKKMDGVLLKNIQIKSMDDLDKDNIYNPNTDRHKRKYLFHNVKICMLHAHLSKEDRIGNLAEFMKEPTNAILLCTDIVARGINFNSLNVVIQYDPPQNFEDYVHTIGRTARLNDEGYSYLFLSKSEKDFLNILKRQNMKVQTIAGTKIINHFKNLRIPQFLKSVGREILYFLQNHFMSIVRNDKLLMEKSTDAFLSTVSSYYSISKNLRSIFNAKELHLGHLAFTFLLEKTPREISQCKKRIMHLKGLRYVTESNGNNNNNKRRRKNA